MLGFSKTIKLYLPKIPNLKPGALSDDIGVKLYNEIQNLKHLNKRFSKSIKYWSLKTLTLSYNPFNFQLLRLHFAHAH